MARAPAGARPRRGLERFRARISGIRGLHLISDQQTDPLIEGSVHLAEQTVKRSLDER
jgi:hypothetical protein